MADDAFLQECAKAIAGVGDVDSCVKHLYSSPRVGRILQFYCAKHGVRDQVEDVRQEVALLFATKLLSSLRDDQGVFPVIAATTERICLNRRAKHRETLLRDFAKGMEGESDGDIADQVLAGQASNGSQAGDLLDVSSRPTIAGDRHHQFIKRLAGSGFHGVELDLDAATRSQASSNGSGADADDGLGDDRRQATAAIAKLRPQRGELYELKERSGLTSANFAANLGITIGKLQPMLYGGAVVDEALLQSARDLVRVLASARRDIAVADDSMQDRCRRWLVTLGWMEPTDVEPPNGAFIRLADLLKVDRATTWRWWAKNRTPRQVQIAKYEVVVTLAAKAQRVAVPSPLPECACA